MCYNKSVIIVVEGQHDKDKLLKVNKNLNILVTGGSSISKTFIESLVVLAKKEEIVLFLDPDSQGRAIAKKINERVKTKELFIEKNEAISKNKTKLGVEHAKVSVLRDILKGLPETKNKETISYSEYLDLGLSGSKSLREKVGKHFHLGYGNGKAMFKRLNMYQIKKEDILKFYDANAVN